MSYAAKTDVPVAKSKAEVEAIVGRYGATSFAIMSKGDLCVIAFEADRRRVAFELPLPKKADFATRKKWGKTVKSDPAWQEREWEQACRQRWRALALVIKAKLEAVEAGIATFESEFLANIVLANGTTVGRWVGPQLQANYDTGKLPPLLPG